MVVVVVVVMRVTDYLGVHSPYHGNTNTYSAFASLFKSIRLIVSTATSPLTRVVGQYLANWPAQ